MFTYNMNKIFYSYGDCYPKSVGGRLFAVMWILVGMCIISIFTAALTSSLTALSLETKVNLPGAKVGTVHLEECRVVNDVFVSLAEMCRGG